MTRNQKACGFQKYSPSGSTEQNKHPILILGNRITYRSPAIYQQDHSKEIQNDKKLRVIVRSYSICMYYCIQFFIQLRTYVALCTGTSCYISSFYRGTFTKFWNAVCALSRRTLCDVATCHQTLCFLLFLK